MLVDAKSQPLGVAATASTDERGGHRVYDPRWHWAELDRANTDTHRRLIGLVWGGVWHFYADYIGVFGNRGWWGFWLALMQAPILLSAHAVMLSSVYNHTRGSMLLCVVFHTAISSSGLLFGSQYPSSALYLAWATVFAALAWIAAGMVVLARRQMPGQRSELQVA